MRTAIRSILAFALFMAAAPAYSSELIHMYRCEQEVDLAGGVDGNREEHLGLQPFPSLRLPGSREPLLDLR